MRPTTQWIDFIQNYMTFLFGGDLHEIENACLVRLKEALPEGTKVTILTDRGFGDVKLFRFLAELGFG
jgi:hypothetical protein